jgi:predicted HNH restriction endonuclease
LVPGAQNTSREGSIRTRERWPLIVKYSGEPDGVNKVVAAGVTKRHLSQVERHGQLFFDTSPDFAERKLVLSPGGQPSESQDSLPTEEEESRFAEGAVRYRLHRTLERDTILAKRVKSKRLAALGRLECEVCKFDFAHEFGSLGRGFIEAHHTVPVSELDGATKTREADFALVCANCHRMLHYGPRLLSVAELRNLRPPRDET